MISVIIPTFNRYDDLLKAVESVKNQIYHDFEIIIVNDASTDPRYYEQNITDCQIINLDKNSKILFGFPCAGYVRNEGAKVANGEWLAFLDDDDTWISHKLQYQLQNLYKTKQKMSCTEGFISPWYVKYNYDYYWNKLKDIYKDTSFLDKGKFPNIWTKSFIDVHNTIITSSVIIDKNLFWQLDGFNNLPNGQEDYDLWKRALEFTDCCYVHEPCFVYNYRWI